MSLLVIGHRNPDTDAICSAIGYAAFLRASKNEDAQEACCGELNVRTNWVLKQAGLEPPKLVLDVRPTAASIARRQVVTASPDETLLAVNRRLLEHEFRSIPVVDEEGRLLGMPSLADIAQLLMPPTQADDANHRRVRTSLHNMVEVLEAARAGTAEASRQVEELILTIAGSSRETTKARATSQISITRRRSQRSTIAPTGSASSTKGVERSAVTQPTVSGEPVNASTSSG